MDTDLDWERLARFVRAARGARSQAAIRINGGPSDETISKIEQNRWRPTRSVEKTLEKLEAGLDWAPGSADAVLAGGDPTPIHSEPTLQSQHPAVVAEWKPTDKAKLSKLVDLWRKAQPLTQPEVFLVTRDFDWLTDNAVALARDVTAYTEETVGGFTKMAALAHRQLNDEDREAGQQHLFDDNADGERRLVIVTVSDPDEDHVSVVSREEFDALPADQYDILCAVEPGGTDAAAIEAGRMVLRRKSSSSDDGQVPGLDRLRTHVERVRVEQRNEGEKERG